MVKEIHLANIMFTDQSITKVRPILILKINSFGDLIYLPLTTNLNINGIKISNQDIEAGYLPKISNIIYEKISIVHKDLISKYIATISEKSYKHIIKELIKFLNENN